MLWNEIRTNRLLAGQERLLLLPSRIPTRAISLHKSHRILNHGIDDVLNKISPLLWLKIAWTLCESLENDSDSLYIDLNGRPRTDVHRTVPSDNSLKSERQRIVNGTWTTIVQKAEKLFCGQVATIQNSVSSTVKTRRDRGIPVTECLAVLHTIVQPSESRLM